MIMRSSRLYAQLLSCVLLQHAICARLSTCDRHATQLRTIYIYIKHTAKVTLYSDAFFKYICLLSSLCWLDFINNEIVNGKCELGSEEDAGM